MTTNNSSSPSVLYEEDGRVARITLNRPTNYNAIDETMPLLLQQCVEKANDNPNIRVILLCGAGESFCTGYDLKIFAETPRPCPGSQGIAYTQLLIV